MHEDERNIPNKVLNSYLKISRNKLINFYHITY